MKIRNSISSKNVNDIVLDIVLKKIKKSHKNNFKIAEFGAGSGEFSEILRKILNDKIIDYEYDCYDIEPEQINNRNLDFQCNYFDAQQKFDINKKYDIIIAVEIIEHIENPFHFIREISKITCVGSLVIITTPNTLSLSSRFRYFFSGCYDYFRRPYNEHWLNMGHLNPVNPIQLNYILRKNGFKIKNSYTNPAYPFSYFLCLFTPFIYLYSYFHYILREKSKGQKLRNKKLFKIILNLNMLFGRIAIFEINGFNLSIAKKNIWHSSDNNFKK